MRKPFNVIPEISDKSMIRFLSKIKVDDDHFCWEFKGTISPYGYGVFSIGGKIYMAHRVSWSVFENNPDPILLIDHQCKNRKCVNPSHLRLVNEKTNTLENSNSTAYFNSLKTHCPKGHEYTPENIYMNYGSRRCATCTKARTARDKARKKCK